MFVSDRHFGRSLARRLFMARSKRSTRLDSRTGRLKLAINAREFLTIGKGLALGYRRTEAGYGTWQARVWNGSKYLYQNLGRADDFQDADGQEVLDFYQAQGSAREFFDRAKSGLIGSREDMTVNEAADLYLEWFREHRKGVKEAENAVRVHIRPSLGQHKIADLTAPTLRSWLEGVAAAPARVRTSKFALEQQYRAPSSSQAEKRARKSSANRTLNFLKAILNRAFHEEYVADNSAWKKVKPFPKVDEAKIRYLTDAECRRLINSCSFELRPLVQAALLTGARYGELTALKTHDVDLRTGKIHISESKSGRPRYVPLNPEGKDLFRAQLIGKTGKSLVFTRSDGREWKKNHHRRALQKACAAAKILPAISFHELRHTYASHLAQVGVDLLTISKLLGHADTRITSKHYAHLADKTLSDAVERLPSFSTNESHMQNSSLGVV